MAIKKDKQKNVPSPAAVKPGYVDDCPCTQVRCPRYGNCVECIRVHRTQGRHVPECMQGMFRDLVRDLAARVEFDVLDTRRTPEFWDTYYRKKKT